MALACEFKIPLLSISEVSKVPLRCQGLSIDCWMVSFRVNSQPLRRSCNRKWGDQTFPFPLGPSLESLTRERAQKVEGLSNAWSKDEEAKLEALSLGSSYVIVRHDSERSAHKSFFRGPKQKRARRVETRRGKQRLHELSQSRLGKGRRG